MSSVTYQDNEFPLIGIFVIERAVRHANVHGRAAGRQDRLHRERTGYIFQAQGEHGVYALKVEKPRFYSLPASETESLPIRENNAGPARCARKHLAWQIAISATATNNNYWIEAL